MVGRLMASRTALLKIAAGTEDLGLAAEGTRLCCSRRASFDRGGNDIPALSFLQPMLAATPKRPFGLGRCDLNRPVTNHEHLRNPCNL